MRTVLVGHVVWPAKVITASLLMLVVSMLAAPVADAQPVWSIEPDGVGPVRLGDTIDQVADALPDGVTLSDEQALAPGLRGYVVEIDGTPEVLIPTPADGTIDEIIVVGAQHRTAAGIGPGSLVSEAEVAYGDVRLSTDGDREVATFRDAPDEFRFRTSEQGGPLAGIYPSQGDRTAIFFPDASLSSVAVVIITDTDTDGPDELPRTGSDPVVLALVAVALYSLGRGVLRQAHDLSARFV